MLPQVLVEMSALLRLPLDHSSVPSLIWLFLMSAGVLCYVSEAL
jgi:hypothetical protein